MVSFKVENKPLVVLLWASIMPANCPPSEVMEMNACSMAGKPTWPDSTSFFTSESDTPNCLASCPMIGMPRPVSWLMSSANKRPWTRALP